MHVDACYLIAHRFPPGVEAVEHAEKDVTHRHALPPFPPGTDGSHSWVQTRVPGHTRERPQLIQSDDGLHRSTPASSYRSSADSIFISMGGPQTHMALGMTDLRRGRVALRRAKGERRKANSDKSKSLFWNILPITPTGSIFCGEYCLIAFCFQYFVRDMGEGVHASCQLPVSQLPVVRQRVVRHQLINATLPSHSGNP